MYLLERALARRRSCHRRPRKWCSKRRTRRTRRTPLVGVVSLVCSFIGPVQQRAEAVGTRIPKRTHFVNLFYSSYVLSCTMADAGVEQDAVRASINQRLEETGEKARYATGRSVHLAHSIITISSLPLISEQRNVRTLTQYHTFPRSLLLCLPDMLVPD